MWTGRKNRKRGFYPVTRLLKNIQTAMKHRQCEESRGIDLIAISYNGCQTRRLDVNIGQNQGKCGVISSPIVVHTGVRWQRLDILQTLLHSVA